MKQWFRKKRNMNLLALWSQLISTLAVIITVIYLTIQISDNTAALLNQSHYNALSIGQNPIVMMVDNAELAAIVEKGYRDPGLLTRVERLRFYDHQFLSFNGWEYLFYANTDESIPESLWIGADGYFGDLVHSKPGLKKFWTEYRHAFAEPFRSYVEEIFTEAEQTRNKTLETVKEVHGG